MRFASPPHFPGLVALAAAALLPLFALACATGGPAADDGMVHVIFEIQLGEARTGTIEVALDTVHAPLTAAQMLRHVDAGFYDGGTFFRTVKPDNQPNDAVKIQVIQCDVARGHRAQLGAPIPLERTSVTGLQHLDGTLSMPRRTPDSGLSGFSIVIHAQPEMDFGGKRQPDGQGFAAFGRVVRGMDVVHAIQSSPAEGQNLTPPITIVKAYRKVPPAAPQR